MVTLKLLLCIVNYKVFRNIDWLMDFAAFRLGEGHLLSFWEVTMERLNHAGEL